MAKGGNKEHLREREGKGAILIFLSGIHSGDNDISYSRGSYLFTSLHQLLSFQHMNFVEHIQTLALTKVFQLPSF
jgi:hypothetical protein